MKSFGLTFAAAVLIPLAGCKWLEEHMNKDPNSGKTVKGQLPKDVKPEQLVGYVNEHAARLQSITYAEVRVTATDRSSLVSPPITLRGDLFASQPRDFRLAAAGMVLDTKVLLGSNDQQFWVYAKVPTIDAKYVYASHTDFAEGKAKIPGIPFEPDWVMQTLGMITLPPPAPPEAQPGVLPPGAAMTRYSLKPDETKRTHTLSWPAVLPGGMPVVKEIVFDTDPATDTKPQVKKHVVRDAKTGKIICSAEIKSAKTVRTSDPRSKEPIQVQYPTRVVLKWEELKFEMDLEVLKANINQPLTPEEARRQFTRPNIPGSEPINLAGGTVFFDR